MASNSHFLATLSFFFFLCLFSANGWLHPNFYAKTCPNLESIVRSVLKPAIAKEPRLGASLIRLHFHDCFVNGCDGSILLDDTDTFTGEQTALQNNNSIRGFEAIDAIKAQVEAACKGIVSCADIVALAARDGSVLLKGPSWTVPLGRRDARTASLSDATNDLPLASMNLSALISNFAAKGLNAREMTILSGSHTVGLARCVTFRARIYNETNIDPKFAATRRTTCPVTTGDSALAPLDVQTPNQFDNKYYRNLIAQRGLLHSDQVLFDGGSQDEAVRTYSANTAAFFKDFAAAMVKMGNISPLTGTRGEIRTNCRVVN